MLCVRHPVAIVSSNAKDDYCNGATKSWQAKSKWSLIAIEMSLLKQLTSPAKNSARAIDRMARASRLVTEHKSTAIKPTNDDMANMNPRV